MLVICLFVGCKGNLTTDNSIESSIEEYISKWDDFLIKYWNYL